MTIDGKLLGETQEVFTVPGRKHWLEKVSSRSQNGFAPYPNPVCEKKRIVVVDVPIQWMYSPGYGSQSLEMFLKRMAAKCQFLLESEGTRGVLFLIDKGSPEPKAVFRKADTNTVPKTPLSLSPDRKKCWDEWFKLRPFTNDDAFGERRPTPSSENNYQLPQTIPLVSERSAKFPKDAGYPYYQHCLSNTDFKQYLYSKTCEAMLRLVDVPDEKWLLVSGPGFCRLKEGPRATNSVPTRIIMPEPRLQYAFQEVDTTVGYWAMFLAGHFDVDIDSNDGDSIMCALLATNLRMFPCSGGLETARFRNTVRVVRHQWEDRATEVVDINELFTCIHRVFETCCPEILDPIGTYVALGMLLGNDYVQGLPWVTAPTVFKAFFSNYQSIGSLFLEARDKCNRIVLDWEAYQRLVCSIYATCYPNLSIDLSGANSLVATLLAAKKPPVCKVGKSKGIVSVATLRVRFANLCWCLNYFHSVAYGECWTVDHFEVDADEVSLWGYTRNSPDLDDYGQRDVTLAENASVELLVANLRAWNRDN